ncbi:hypothetical protein ACHAPO_009007 [Fusarium lateritium]
MTSTNNLPLISVTADTGETTFRSIVNNFWPSFKQEVESDERNIRPHALQCFLCAERLFTQPGQVRYDGHYPWIIPCGHMLGYSCLQNMAHDILGFFDKNLDLSCPICHAAVPLQGCGCKAMGMQAPLDKEFFSTVPPVSAECGLTATSCGICEGKSVLQELREVAALDPPIFKRGETMNLSLVVEPSGLGIVYQKDHYQLVNPGGNRARRQKMMMDWEIPKDVRDLWEDYVKTWSEQQRLWIFPHPRFFTLCASVEKEKDEKKEDEEEELLEKLKDM